MMATQANYELSRPEVDTDYTLYTPAPDTLVTQQPRSITTVTVLTWWEVLEGAAQRIYGGNIILNQNIVTRNELDNLVADLQFTVVNCEPQPRETKQTIIDMSSKEYINRSEHEKDETFIKLRKTPLATGNRYNFYTTSGVSWATNGNLGAQILSMAMSGGTMRVGSSKDQWQVQGQDNAINPHLEFQYFQKEKVTIPPRTKVTAKITTSTVKVEQGYTLQFFIASRRTVTISYNNPGCFGCCNATGYVNAAELFRALPDYQCQNGLAYFTQVGNLMWIGEKCIVDKSEERL